MQPHLTVVVTTYNRAMFLSEALASIARQTFHNFIVLICDNASSDQTAEVASAYAARDPRFVYCRRPRNIGALSNLRQGITESSTDFVAWLMDDDVWGPDHLAHGIRRLSRSRNTTLYACGTERFVTEGPSSILRPWFVTNPEGGDTVVGASRNYHLLLPSCSFVGSSVIFRRDALPDNLQSLPEIPEVDWLLWGLIALNGTVVYNPSVHVRYRWHTGNDSHTIGGRGHAARNNQVRRYLTLSALKCGAMTRDDLFDFLRTEQHVEAVRAVALALCGGAVPESVRSVALEVLRARPELSKGEGRLRLLRVAHATGGVLYPAFDCFNRIVARCSRSYWSFDPHMRESGP